MTGPALLALTLMLTAAAGAAATPCAKHKSADPTALVVGVRADARPFSYRTNADQRSGRVSLDGALRLLGYDGYVVEICESVLSAMENISRARGEPDTVIETCEVTAKSRFDDLAAGKVDLLCEPASITPRRTQTHLVSIPIYLSGATYAVQREVERDIEEKAVVGFVGGTTSAGRGLKAIAEAGAFDALESFGFRRCLSALSEGAEAFAAAATTTPPNQERCDKLLRPYPDHDALTRAFCDGLLRYYVGDIEIVTAQLTRNGCPYDGAKRTYSDEQYAIYMRNPVADDDKSGKARRLLNFMATLNVQAVTTPSILDTAYLRHLGDFEQSRKLQLFYWSIRGPRPGYR